MNTEYRLDVYIGEDTLVDSVYFEAPVGDEVVLAAAQRMLLAAGGPDDRYGQIYEHLGGDRGVFYDLVELPEEEPRRRVGSRNGAEALTLAEGQALAAYIDARDGTRPLGGVVRMQHRVRLGRRWSQWAMPCLTCGRPTHSRDSSGLPVDSDCAEQALSAQLLALASEWKFAGGELDG